MKVGRKHKVKIMLCLAVHRLLSVANKKKRKYWVKAWMADRNGFGQMPLLRQLQENFPADFKNYLRMDSNNFSDLLELVSPLISKQNTQMRESISAEQRLMTTLRYLATGRSFEDLKFSTGISAPSLCKLIPETCKAIYDVLKGSYLKVSNKFSRFINIFHFI